MLALPQNIQRLTKILSILTALTQVIAVTHGALTCHQCSGIQCQRSSSAATTQCADGFDVCVTIFAGQLVQVQGCLGELPADLRAKCNTATHMPHPSDSECYKCEEHLCNNLGSSDFACLQCESNTNENCRKNTSTLTPTRCPISRASKSYCYVRDDMIRTVRGCSGSLLEQKQCLEQEDCTLCDPSEISGCNGMQISRNDGGAGTDSDANGTGTATGSGAGTGSDGEAGAETGTDSDGNAGTGNGTGSGGETGAGNGSGSDGDETGTGTGTGSDAGTGTGAGADGNGGAGTGTGSNGDAETGTGTGSDGEDETGTGTGSDGNAGAGTGTGSNGDAEIGTGTGSDGNAGAGDGTGSDGDAETGTGTSTGEGGDNSSGSNSMHLSFISMIAGFLSILTTKLL